jgi:cellulose synthase/poly-beta-1,6-N-acetylglucosamine synthase-like glycosyltransferase
VTVVLSVLVVLVALVLTAVATMTLWWMLHAWRSPTSFESIREGVDGDPKLSFSLIVPCRDESQEVMEETVRRLLAQDHPDLEIIISLGHDDQSTIAAAHSIADTYPGRVRLSINHEPKKSKPVQLNSTLLECTKDIVGIIDAESLTAPGLLRRIDQTFRTEKADIVQGAVHLVNLRSHWFSLRNCLEYRIWFRSRLHGHANKGFVPLGGNTVFIWRDLLEEVGGWDTGCLAEDAEIGVRLSVMNKVTVCLYESDIVTQEETPNSVQQFVKQRTRWSLGFMQVMAKGEWKKLPTRWERARAVLLLGQQYTVAFSGLVLPLAVLSAVLGNLPVLVVMLAFLPLIPSILTLCFEILILIEFGHDLSIKIGIRDCAWLVLCTPLYQVLLAYSSLRAVAKYYQGNFAWEKTSHAGAHLDLPLLQPADLEKGAA